jgi:hypothetical protein
MPVPQCQQISDLFDYPPDRDKRGRDGGGQSPYCRRTFIGQSQAFFDLIADLAADADAARREFEPGF